jgi:hypothetical protein
MDKKYALLSIKIFVYKINLSLELLGVQFFQIFEIKAGKEKGKLFALLLEEPFLKTDCVSKEILPIFDEKAGVNG